MGRHRTEDDLLRRLLLGVIGPILVITLAVFVIITVALVLVVFV